MGKGAIYQAGLLSAYVALGAVAATYEAAAIFVRHVQAVIGNEMLIDAEEMSRDIQGYSVTW